MGIRTFIFEISIYSFLALGGSAAISIWETYVNTSVHSPICVVSMLGSVLPQAGVYYVIAVLNQTTYLPQLVVWPSRIWAAIRGKLKEGPINFDLANESLRLARVLNMGLMVSVLCPLIFPACAIFFTSAMVAYQWMFHRFFGGQVTGGHFMMQKNHCHGLLWYESFDCTMLGLVLGTGAVTGVMLICMADTPDAWTPFLTSGFMAILLFIIWRFWHHCHNRYKGISDVMPLEDALSIDNHIDHDRLVSTFREDCFTDFKVFELLQAMQI